MPAAYQTQINDVLLTALAQTFGGTVHLDLEGQALETFKDLITTADHKARMDMRLYAEDAEGGLRSAARAGGNAPAIAKARIAVSKKVANARKPSGSVRRERGQAINP